MIWRPDEKQSSKRWSIKSKIIDVGRCRLIPYKNCGQLFFIMRSTARSITRSTARRLIYRSSTTKDYIKGVYIQKTYI